MEEYRGSIEHVLYDNRGEREGIWIAMPDSDIANVGKQRCAGVAYLCGDFLETITTSSLFLAGVAPITNETIARPPETAEETAKRCAVRAQKNIRRVVNTNRMKMMWTLTLCPANSIHSHLYPEPVCNLTQTHYKSIRGLWTRFTRKLKRAFGEVQWVLVLELHDSDKTAEVKRGTYHLHFATNQYLDWAAINDLWGHGNVRFDDFTKPKKGRKDIVRNPGAYMSKYIGKSFDKHTSHLKRFTCSRNTLRPQKISLETAEAILLQRGGEMVYNQYREFLAKAPMSYGENVYGVSQQTYQLKGVQP